MQGLYKGLGLQSNLEEKILTTNTDINNLHKHMIYNTHYSYSLIINSF